VAGARRPSCLATGKGDSPMKTMLHSDDLCVLLLDADGSLFPSETPAFEASADVTNRFLAALGIQATYTPEHLLATTTGKNFRTTAADLAAAHGVTPNGAMLDDWVAEEKKVVSAHLGRSSSRCTASPGATGWRRSARAPCLVSTSVSGPPASPS
jgi:hypothetical protein